MNLFVRIITWAFNCLFWPAFGIIICVFHPIQVVARAISEQAHTQVVNAMIWCLNQSLMLVGNRISYHIDLSKIPDGRPLIITSNHQSMFDIPAIGWAFRKYRPKYIAKSSLGKGIPSISYNIRHGGSTTVKLNNAREAIKSIDAFGKRAYEKQYMAVIFPEGARSRDGVPYEFKSLGFKKLYQTMPNAVIIPVVLHQFWKFERYLCKPVPLGTHKHLYMLDPIIDETDPEVILDRAKLAIHTKLLQLNEIDKWETIK